ncbi:threonine--tRNA ligase [Candidatus Shapirobacteria bacterium CG08_land_8_20_14_0_20_39_18]|uniref:Threonine--tRNA ligase n=1 Tax=Candidatus Shapirobacteria bacterium CG08_land_8_20_14_0_20_39_18 TaxID=1974883 RepID=A0A2M6XDD8_9BACT|nr:MAG: threonine--tRNA ligase [Candidatus Shapirobacteria bacterium CG08_land_8_20_14_0_20_39_18]PIY66174.1 MAG: threonine--tRNA ligase [Candidatus Shapirobacteria bacterium CG_4_10_14_0_8_um_filter_39_15]
MSQKLEDKLEKMTPEEQKLWALRHTAEHVLHAAMQNLYPQLKKAMGPATSDGFYFDFDLQDKISGEDFPKIEKEMQKLIDADLPMIQENITPAKARELFKDNPYKLEWIQDIEKRGEKISTYKMGDSDLDICSGPHAKSTGEIKAFKLLSVAGAYWHGSEKNKMLTRIYGTAFPSKKELDNYLALIAETQKRDHRKLGAELDLFSFSPLTGPGLVLWHPKLAISRIVAEQFWRDEHQKNGYKFVFTPHIASMDMFVLSRHYLKYIDYMFPVMLHQYIEGGSASDYSTEEQLKPMNCPNHIQIYKSRPRSYKELPIRMAELGTVYRYERAGTLHGMTRVRGFTQDDTHIFCRPDQIVEEVRGVLRLTKHIYKIYGFKDFQAYLATRPEKYLGTNEMWKTAEDSLKKALEEEKIDYKIDEGQGVFYGPKIDSKIKDSIGREWQLGTIQVDFNLPSRTETTDKEVDSFWKLKTFKDKFQTREKLDKYLKKLGRGFNVTFINNQGLEEQAVMIHRTIYGSLERFFGILIEHYAGAFPVWLAPVQVQIIPIASRHYDYANQIVAKLKGQDIRVEIAPEAGTMQVKIRDAELEKIPYMLIVGDREVSNNTVSVRTRGQKDLGAMEFDKFLSKIKSEIVNKSQV